jgi:hypothetical protein
MGDWLIAIPGDGSIRANLHTGTALDAAVFKNHHIHPAALTFWIMAPPAAQRAAFQENHTADARTVVNRVAADVEYQTSKSHTIASIPQFMIRALRFVNRRSSRRVSLYVWVLIRIAS